MEEFIVRRNVWRLRSFVKFEMGEVYIYIDRRDLVWLG